MSYINEALRKAQRERDNRYGKFGGIITAGAGGAERPRKRRFLLFAAGSIILAAALVLPAVRALRSAPPAGKPPVPVVSTVPASPGPAVKMEAKGAETAQPPGGTQALLKPEARFGEALLAQHKGDLARAEALYQEVLALDAGHVRALNNLGVIYMTQKQREKAVSVLNRAITLKKDYVDPYYNLACLYAQANEIPESIRYLKIAATLDGRVIDSVQKDADMKNVVASPEFKKLMEGQKN